MSLANSLREAKGGACPEWHLDKEILEKNARNKIRVHQCLLLLSHFYLKGLMNTKKE